MSSLITALGEALAIATRDESTFERAEACYQAKFRSEAYSLQSITNLDWLEEVKSQIARGFKIYSLLCDGKKIVTPTYSGEYYYPEPINMQELEDFEELLDSMVVDIPPQTLICDLCNYKGEGEGIALYDAVKHLPIFRSKSDSFSHFGA